MISIARYKRTFLAQMIFLATNAVGVFFGVVYNAQTPELYENNAHRKIGLVATCLAFAQAIVGLLVFYGRATRQEEEYHDVRYDKVSETHQPSAYRYSRDSGTGTEPESSRTPPLGSPSDEEFDAGAERFKLNQADLDEINNEEHGLLGESKIDQYLSEKVKLIATRPVLRVTGVVYEFLDRTILIMAFIAITSGIATYGGHFVSLGPPPFLFKRH